MTAGSSGSVAVPSKQKWPAGQGWSARAVPVTSHTWPAGHNLGTVDLAPDTEIQ